jgi:hypothetical protein
VNVAACAMPGDHPAMSALNISRTASLFAMPPPYESAGRPSRTREGLRRPATNFLRMPRGPGKTAVVDPAEAPSIASRPAMLLSAPMMRWKRLGVKRVVMDRLGWVLGKTPAERVGFISSESLPTSSLGPSGLGHCLLLIRFQTSDEDGDGLLSSSGIPTRTFHLRCATYAEDA